MVLEQAIMSSNLSLLYSVWVGVLEYWLKCLIQHFLTTYTFGIVTNLSIYWTKNLHNMHLKLLIYI